MSPTRLHDSVKDLKLQISQSKQKFTKFMCEVPTVTGEYGDITLPADFQSPYSPAPGRVELVCTTEHITEINYQIATDAKSAFKQCHQVLRDPTKELLVFMLMDKDRKQDNNIPYSYPMAYAMKGSSITHEHMKFMLHKVRRELKSRNVMNLSRVFFCQLELLLPQFFFSLFMSDSMCPMIFSFLKFEFHVIWKAPVLILWLKFS